MRDKVLMLASVASMIDQFNIPNIKLLIEMGYKVDVACNFIEGSTCSDAKIEELKNKLTEMGVDYYQIDCARSVRHIWQNLKAYRQVLSLMKANRYKFVHCHSPIGGVCGRIAGHKTHTKVIYTAHGFHFYKGAPLLNWLVYYPIEKYLSRYTDVLITINKEDYAIAKNKMHAKQTEYVPGVGINIEKIKNIKVDRNKKRAELGIPEDSFIFISIGELNKNKNHEIVIQALAKLQNIDDVHYVIAGQGKLYGNLKAKTIKLGVYDHVHLLGFRTDIIELLKSSDCFVFPSRREGLGIAALESMAAGLPLIASIVGGIKDYAEDGRTGYCIDNSKSVNEMSCAMQKILDNPKFRESCGLHNTNVVWPFDIQVCKCKMSNLYKQLYSGIERI